MSAALRVGLAGLGNVGAGVAKVLRGDTKALAWRAGRDIQITAVSARDRRRERGVDLSGARFRDVNLTDVTITHAWVRNVDVDALVDHVTINGVDVTDFVINAAAATVNEAGTLQLGAWQLLDDATYLSVAPTAVT